MSPGRLYRIFNLLKDTDNVEVVQSTHGLCRIYGRLQMDFVSVERVVEMIHLEQEPLGDIDPPASWPSYKGDIVFEDVTMRYAPNLDPSLSNISLRIPGGATAALLGRTGITFIADHGRLYTDSLQGLARVRWRSPFLQQVSGSIRPRTLFSETSSRILTYHSPAGIRPYHH